MEFCVYYMNITLKFLLAGGRQYVETVLVKHWVAQMLHGWYVSLTPRDTHWLTVIDDHGSSYHKYMLVF